MIWKTLPLTGWGRSGTATCEAARPERIAGATAAMAVAAGAEDGRGILAHGAGRSYGDCALNDGGRVVLTGRLDRILSFDAATGEVVAEPGVTFRDLLDVFLPRGFLAPVTPGTAFATLGGAVANDVHGKNHESAGSFGDHVRWLDLLLPSGEVVRTSPDARPDLFRATVGGIGLTGVILAVCLRLARVPSNAVELSERRIPDLDAYLAAFAEAGPAGAHSVGWLDAMARGAALGRGILETAVPAPAGLPERAPRARAVPLDMPPFLLNGLSVAAFNEAYFRRIPARGRQRLVPYGRFLYPLDAILGWNRLYGRPGFRQFQCVVPAAEGPAALRRLLEEISRSRGASFLAVLKALGPAGRGYLSFPMGGYTLALDFPRRAGTDELFRTLERITRDHGGRIYLAKDSVLSAEGFAEMYPELPRLRAVLDAVDPRRRMRSDMARRLRIREDAA